MREEKCVADSITTQVQIIMEKDINGANRLFGGQLLEWIDVVAAVVARRHCHREVTTAAIDNLQFPRRAGFHPVFGGTAHPCGAHLHGSAGG